MSKLIALDDGHGIETPGKRTPDGKVRENQFNRAVIAKLDVALRRCGFETIFTAPGDNDVPLQQRVDVANKAGADAFVSNHYNAFNSVWESSKGGIETHYYPGSVEGKRLATCVQKYIAQGTPQVNRGIKASNFAVLRETDMPAILIENGFMDVRKEADLMLNEAYQTEQAEQQAQGICEYFGVPYIKEGVVVGTPILSTPRATVEQALTWAKSKGATAWFLNLAQTYWNLAPIVGADPALLYAQAFKETDGGYRNAKSGAKIDSSYNNPCGLKVSAGGSDKDPAAHKKFTTPEAGVQAHIDHAALYAGAPGYPKAITPDPRHFPYIKGDAATVEALGGKWAPNPDYGKSIVEGYLKPLMATVAIKQPVSADERALKRLYDEGIIVSPHDLKDNVTWAELAHVVGKVLDKR